MTDITIGPIGRQDLEHWNGDTNYNFERPSSTGGRSTLNRIGNVVDLLPAFGGGVNRTKGTIDAAVKAIGNNNALIAFAPGTWTIDANLTIPSNIDIVVPRGALLEIAAGITLTISGTVLAGAYQITSGSGTFTVANKEGFIFGAWTSGTAVSGILKVNAHVDTDGDTGVEVEQAADEDKVRIKVAGNELVVITANGLSVYDSSGNQIHSFGAID